NIFHQLAAPHGPADEDRLLEAEVIHEFFIIARPRFGQVSIMRFVALALRTRIDSNHVILLREVIDLLLPDPGRYRPARNEDNRSAAARLKVVDPDAIGGLEELAL